MLKSAPLRLINNKTWTDIHQKRRYLWIFCDWHGQDKCVARLQTNNLVGNA